MPNIFSKVSGESKALLKKELFGYLFALLGM